MESTNNRQEGERGGKANPLPPPGRLQKCEDRKKEKIKKKNEKRNGKDEKRKEKKSNIKEK